MSDNLANIADTTGTSLEAYEGEETKTETTSTLKNVGNLALSAFVAGCVGYTSIKLFEGASNRICKFLNKKADEQEKFDRAVEAMARKMVAEEIVKLQAQSTEPEEQPQEQPTKLTVVQEQEEKE